jgi:hypothetical protein
MTMNRDNLLKIGQMRHVIRRDKGQGKGGGRAQLAPHFLCGRSHPALVKFLEDKTRRSPIHRRTMEADLIAVNRGRNFKRSLVFLNARLLALSIVYV